MSEEAASAGETERKRIAGRAGVTAAGTLVSRVLGLGREQALAGLFTRAETDAFFVAWLLPNLLRQLLAEGAVQSAVVPVLAETREQHGDAAARRFFRAIRGLSLISLVIVTALCIAFAPQLVELFAGGFRDQPGQMERTVTLTRWLFPYIFFMGTAALGMAALNTHKRFAVAAFAPGLLNVAFIAAALILPGWLGARGYERTLAMAVGALVGGALQVVAQWPSLKKIGYLDSPILDFKAPGVAEALRRMTPILAGTGVYYLDVLVSRRLLSELPLGAQSYFGFALRLCDFPQGIFVMALSTATLPSLALLAAKKQYDEVGRTFAFGMRLALFVGLATTALFVVLAEPLVIAIFQRGHFDAAASRETAHALVAQGLGIWMVAAVRQLVAVYYALGDTRTPVIVSAVDFVAFVVIAVALRGPLGHVGISVAVTGASTVQMLLLWLLLKRRLADTCFAEIARSMARTLAAIAPAALVAVVIARALAGFTSGSGVERLVPGTVAALAFGLIFVGAARMLKSDELATVLGALRRRRRQR